MTNRWKSIQIDYADVMQFDDIEEYPVCLNQRQVAILKACLVPAYWSTRWTNFSPTLQNKDALNAMIAEIDSRLDGNDCAMSLMFRDNPDDNCEVQYSTNNGLTWLTMFRKDNCASPGGGGYTATPGDITQIYEDITYITNNNNTWNNDITNVAPDWAYVDTDSDRALCWAIDFYVDAICQVAINEIKAGNDERKSTNDWLDDVSNVIAAGTIAAIASIGITMPAAAVSAVAWATTHIVESVWDYLVTEDYSMYEDEEAKQTIKCMMYQAMQGGTPQFTDWENSVTYYSLMGENEQAIGRMVWKWNSDEDIYINYLLLMQELNDISASLPECPCPTRWEHTWNFATHGFDWWELWTDEGTKVEDFGIEGILVDYSGYTSNVIRYLAFGNEVTSTIPRCDGFEIHYDAVRGGWDANVDSLHLEAKNEATQVYIEQKQNSGWFLGGEDKSWRWNFTLADYNPVRLSLIRSCYTQGVNYGSVLVTGITLHGVGVDPFHGRETS